MQFSFKGKVNLSARILTMFVTSAWTATAMAAATYTISEGKLTIAVPANEDANLDSAQFQAALTAGVTDIEMNGPGRLIANIDTTAYSGAIHILGGYWRVVNSKGLGEIGIRPNKGGDNFYVEAISNKNGVAIGSVYVNGGTLEAVSSANNGINYTGKLVYFQGTGQDGAGALVANLSAAYDTGAVFGANQIMTGDATIANVGKYDSTSFSTNLRMDGHTLTLKGSDNGAGWYCAELRCTAGAIGNIIQQGGRLLYKNYNAMGSTMKTQTITGDGHVDLYTIGGAVYRVLTWDATGVNDWTHPRSPSVNNWLTPITLNRDMTIRGTGKLGGVISGVGGLILQGGDLPNTSCMELTATNTYTGSLTVENLTLKLGNQSLTSSQSAFTATDTAIQFTSSDSVESLPPATVTVNEDQTLAITGGTGSWATSFEKRGAGTLTYNSMIGSDTLKVKAGAMTFQTTTAKSNPAVYGLIEGIGYYPDESSANQALTAKLVFRDRVVPSLAKGSCELFRYVTDCKKVQSWFPECVDGSWYTLDNKTGKRSYYLLTYSGYIWNHSTENVTWSFGCNIVGIVKLFIDGTQVIATSGSTAKAVHGNYTLTPGAHRIYVAQKQMSYDGGPGSGDANWGTVGLLYDPEGKNSDSSADYIAIKNVNGELPLLTCAQALECVENPRGGHFFNYGGYSSKYDELAEVGEYVGKMGATAYFSNISSAVGTTLDFNGASVDVLTFAGAPTFAGTTAYSPLAVANTWTIDASTLPRAGLAAAPMHVASLDFGEDTELVIENPTAFQTPGTTWLLATSDADITGKLSIKSSDASITDRWELEVGARTVTLKRLARGTIMIVK